MAVRKRLLIVPILPLLFLAVSGVLAMNVNYKFVHPLYSNAEFKIIGDSGPKLFIERSEGAPRAEVDQTLHDFGVMNPLSQGRHRFVIRNTGTGTLRLSNKGTSCKCTVADVDSPLLEPGEETTVEVVFNTGRDRNYFQTVTLGTNDVSKKTIRLQIRGDVRVKIDAEPRSVDLGTVDPRKDLPSQRMLVYSEVLHDLRVLQGSLTAEGTKWSISEATAAERSEKNAAGALWVHFSPPPIAAFSSGPFTAVLELEVEGIDEDERLVSETVRLGVGGSVVRRLAIYGQTINSKGEIDLGDLKQGEGTHARLLVKVRDPNTLVAHADLTVVPDFVRATWSQKSGDLYVLDVTVPKDAPVGDYSGNFAGSLTIAPEHESIKPETLRLEFDVIEK